MLCHRFTLPTLAVRLALCISVYVVERGKQRPARCPGGDCGDQHRLRRQRELTRRTQRERSQQRGELIPDRRARKPAGDRFGEPESEHRDAPADHPALEPEP